VGGHDLKKKKRGKEERDLTNRCITTGRGEKKGRQNPQALTFKQMHAHLASESRQKEQKKEGRSIIAKEQLQRGN